MPTKRADLDAVAALARQSGGRAKRSKAPGPSSLVVVHACPAKGLCDVCRWEGRRVPRAWLDERPGTAYDGPSKLLGTVVQLRGDDRPSTVVSLATPLGGSLLQGNRSKRYRCQGSYIVRTPFGRGHIDTVVPKSQVRERQRMREGNCPDAPVYNGTTLLQAVADIERGAKRAHRHPFDEAGAEVPFPHRKGSTACCINSPVSADKLEAMARDFLDTGEPEDFERFAKSMRKALPEPLRSTLEIDDTARSMYRAVDQLKDHCWGLWETRAARARETRKEYRARQKEARLEREAMGLDTGRVRSRATRIETGGASTTLDAVAAMDAGFRAASAALDEEYL